MPGIGTDTGGLGYGAAVGMWRRWKEANLPTGPGMSLVFMVEIFHSYKQGMWSGQTA